MITIKSSKFENTSIGAAALGAAGLGMMLAMGQRAGNKIVDKTAQIYDSVTSNNQQPANSNQQPANSNQQPANSNQQPAKK